MATKRGLGVGNQPPIVSDELYAMLDISPDVLLVLDGQVNEGEWLHQQAPQIPILWRKYDDNLWNRDPIEKAREHADWLTREVLLRVYHGQGPVHFVGFNEGNINDGWGNTERQWDTPALYEFLNDWIVAYVRELRRLCPWAIIHFGAFSPGHNEDGQWVAGERVGEWSGIKLCAEAIHECDVYDMHVYWVPWWAPEYDPGRSWNGKYGGERYWLQWMELGAIDWTSSTCITEWNRACKFESGDEAEYAEEIVLWFENLPRWIDYAIHFIFSGWGLLSIYPGRESVRAALKALRKEETPMPDVNDWPRIWADYLERLGNWPKFEKVALRENLGLPLGDEYEREIGGTTYVLRDFIGGIVYAVKGDWQNTKILRNGTDLPLTPAP